MVRQPAPGLIRQGVYTALGAGLVAGAAALVVVALNPAPKVKKSGCGCGCGGSKTSSAAGNAAKVYG